MTSATPAPSLDAWAATRYSADLLGTGAVMAAPVTGWWAAHLVGTGPARAGLAAAVTVTFLAVGTGLFRSRAPQWNPLLMVADALLERRRSLSGAQLAGHLLIQVGAATAVAGGVVAGYLLAGIPLPAVPAPGGVHALSEMTAAAAAVISLLRCRPHPDLENVRGRCQRTGCRGVPGVGGGFPR
ncbi:hypothetical protein HGA13_08475 [Nocardia speluncae]|uniref:Uncharacterized protein n=1 Tax=Nocardia speluncae TaxID=419477 RepID=A0A846XA11_9NOCA|nr:hypothetical protein [Nocardia speluncae]NKY33101.1 hypothetical protein [Nocardia speluncae]